MIFQNCPNLENFEILQAGIIANYYMQVMLLFVYNNSREISGNAQEIFLFTVKKTTTGVYVRNNLFASMEEIIDSFLWNQYKPFKANNMKQFNESNL